MRIIKKYDNFVNENMEMAKSIIAKKMDAFDKLKTLLSKNIGYIGKFTEYLMDENIGYSDLEVLYKDLMELKSKNNPLDITKLSYEKVTDKIISTNNNILVNGLLKQFPSEQRKLIGDNVDFYFNILLKVAKKDDLKAFISKISRYKNSSELENALKLFSKDSNNDREHVKSIIEGMESYIVFENDNIVIVKVPVIEDIKVLGSDTSWCILSKSNWDSYTKGRLQYVLYNYVKDEHDPKFKIGFTLARNGELYTAHDILDHYSTNDLEKVLEDNDLTNVKLIQMDKDFKVISEEDIDKINSKNSLASLELLINVMTGSDKSIAYKLLIKLFNLFGYKKVDKEGNVIDKHLTVPKSAILTKCIKLLFSDKISDKSAVITEEDFKDMDKRVLMYIKEKHMFKKLMYSPDYISMGVRESLFEYGLDRWSDAKILELLYEGTGSDFLNISSWSVKNYDFSKPLPDDKLAFSRETITKLSDRVNKIYKEGKAKFKRSHTSELVNTDNKAIGRKVILLNYLLGRKDMCPDHDKLFALCIESSYDIEYPGLFTQYIDFTNKKFIQSSAIKVDRLEKKDYPDTPIYFRYTDLNHVQAIMAHLDGYKLLLKGSVQTFKEVVKRPPQYINDYGEQIVAMAKKLPSIESGETITDGNITLIVS